MRHGPVPPAALWQAYEVGRLRYGKDVPRSPTREDGLMCRAGLKTTTLLARARTHAVVLLTPGRRAAPPGERALQSRERTAGVDDREGRQPEDARAGAVEQAAPALRGDKFRKTATVETHARHDPRLDDIQWIRLRMRAACLLARSSSPDDGVVASLIS